VRWWIDSQDVERAIEQVGILFCVWFFRGYVTEGEACLQEVLALPSAPGNSVTRRRGLQILAHLACRHSDFDVGVEALEELLRTEQSAGDRHGVAYAHIELGNVYFLRAAYAAAWASLDKGRREAAELGDQQLENRWRLYASMLALCEGRFELARTLASEASAAFASENKRLPTAYAQMTLGTAELEQGRYKEAHMRLQHELEVALEFGDRTLLAHVLEGLAGLAGASGDHHRALLLGGAAAALREIAGAPLGPAWGRIAERWLATSHQALGEHAASAAWAKGRDLPLERVLDEALAGAGRWARPNPLTAREREIAELVAAGHTNRHIATQLAIAEATVDRHVANIMAKLDVHARAGIAAWAVGHLHSSM
jgi:DNA-binding CsgD family transcriptional regulator